MEENINTRHNWLVNLLDSGFFGFGLGFGSFTAILPLFVLTLTDSALMVGLILAIHNMGWQAPQILTARKLSGIKQFKSLVLFFTIQERIPFLGFAILALLIPYLPLGLVLSLTFVLLIWQGFGSGLAANPWQNLIGRVIPGQNRAMFFGVQLAINNFMAAIGSTIAGFLLGRIIYPYNYSLCFFLTVVFMGISWVFLSQNREPEGEANLLVQSRQEFWQCIVRILRIDKPFVWFIIVRNLYQYALMASAFFTVYAVKYHGMDVVTAGLMGSVLFISQVVANPILGWCADHWSRRGVLQVGAITGGCSALIALIAGSVGWFYLAFVLYGISYTAFWTISLAMSLEFGEEKDRPTYVGLANTLIAPSTILAPIIGGWLADGLGYDAMFIVSLACGGVTALMLGLFVRDPQHT